MNSFVYRHGTETSDVEFCEFLSPFFVQESDISSDSTNPVNTSGSSFDRAFDYHGLRETMGSRAPPERLVNEPEPSDIPSQSGTMVTTAEEISATRRSVVCREGGTVPAAVELHLQSSAGIGNAGEVIEDSATFSPVGQAGSSGQAVQMSQMPPSLSSGIRPHLACVGANTTPMEMDVEEFGQGIPQKAIEECKWRNFKADRRYSGKKRKLGDIEPEEEGSQGITDYSGLNSGGDLVRDVMMRLPVATASTAQFPERPSFLSDSTFTKRLSGTAEEGLVGMEEDGSILPPSERYPEQVMEVDKAGGDSAGVVRGANSQVPFDPAMRDGSGPLGRLDALLQCTAWPTSIAKRQRTDRGDVNDQEDISMPTTETIEQRRRRLNRGAVRRYKERKRKQRAGQQLFELSYIPDAQALSGMQEEQLTGPGDPVFPTETSLSPDDALTWERLLQSCWALTTPVEGMTDPELNVNGLSSMNGVDGMTGGTIHASYESPWMSGELNQPQDDLCLQQSIDGQVGSPGTELEFAL